MKHNTIYIIIVFIALSSCVRLNRQSNDNPLIDSNSVPETKTPYKHKKSDNPPPVSLLFEAIKNNDTLEIRNLILSGCNVNEKIHVGSNIEDAPLRQAVYYCDTSNLRFLLEHGADPNLIINRRMTPTHYAAGSESDKFKLLIKYGGNVNTYSESSNFPTPFMWALSNDKTENIVTMLNESYNIEPNSDNGYNSALAEAISFENIDVIEALINQGANLNVIYSFGTEDCFCACPEKITPMHQLAYSFVNSQKKDQVRILISRFIELGANINAENFYGETPLDFASCSGDTALIKLFLQNGAILGNSIYYASLRSFHNTVEFLLNNGANPNKIVYNQVPLIACLTCCGDGFGSGITREMKLKTINSLLNHGADINIKDNTGNSFIDYVKMGYYTIYEDFIENGTLTWDDINIDYYGDYKNTEIIIADSIKVRLLPNLNSPIIHYLMKNDTILTKVGGSVYTDEKTKTEYKWIQIKYKGQKGFITKSNIKN